MLTSVHDVIKQTLLPPGCFLLLGLGGLALLPTARRLGVRLLAGAILALTLLSLPLTASLLSGLGQRYAPLVDSTHAVDQADVVVVLAGGLYRGAPEYGDDTINLLTLGRLRYAAHLARVGQLPVLVSGGIKNPYSPSRYSEAELAKTLLQQEFGVGRVLIDPISQSTRENALNSAVILRQAHLRKALLVTHALHMARAVRAFRRAASDIEITPAPTLFYPAKPDWLEPYSWLPNIQALTQNYFVLHEWLGEVWYWLRDDLLGGVTAARILSNDG